MDLLTQNLNYLQEVNQNLYDQITNMDIELSHYSVETMFSKLNNLVISENNENIHMYDEKILIDEITCMLESTKESKNIIFFGLGLGYHIQELINQQHVRKIIIVEPDLKNLLLFMNFYNLELFLENNKIELLIFNDVDEALRDLVTNFGSIFNDKIKVETFSFYKKYYKNEYIEFLEKMVRYYSSNVISMNTLIKFGKSYIENGLLNYINHLEESIIIDNLFEQYNGVPAVIVGAGPSLNNQLHLLKELDGKALIFAVGSAMNILDKHGIKHHFKVALDPSEMEAKYFSKLENKDTNLIYMPSLNHKSMEDYTGQKYYSRLAVQQEYVFLEECLEINSSSIKGGGTVSMATVDIAYNFGCDPIILLGQDLSYTPDKFYADGAVNTEHIAINEIVKKDIYGNDVLTNEGLYALKLGFDEFIASNFKDRPVKILNCSEAGLGIEGVDNCSFEKTLSIYCSSDVTDLKDSIYPEKHRLKNSTVKEKFLHLKEELKEIKGTLTKALKIINEMSTVLKIGQNDRKLRYYNGKLKEEIKSLEKIDAFQLWLLPISEARLFLIDDLFEKKYEFIENEKVTEQQRVYIDFMKLQYVEIERMNQFVIDVLEKSEIK
ncbi:motility associated factor glycosyltransferase family protein [Bacillus alkalicellulosilyticus]|uniref:motility associated factor glycosyltransferase family protein n=1 Tax=Alkalihalobacterium alkalicellulosilyticum TaxID=1912214 RepID=UPI00099814C8|nr:6-hydroxymethylpterin diphosphokinase MptE-like protein [Bacillus alkalicellulosilyticus]